MLDQQTIDKIIAPISDSDPSGVSVRYEPEYEKIEEQINQLQSLDGGVPDWQQVIKLSSQLLSTQSKDILIAVYFSCAMFEKDSYRGLAQSLSMFSELMESYWDTMFPTLDRIRGRVSAFQWFANFLETRLEKKNPLVSEYDFIEQTQLSMEKIQKQLNDKMEANSPDFSLTNRILKDQLSKLKKPTKSAPTQPITSASADSVLASIESDADFQKALKQCQQLLKLGSEYLTDKKPTDARLFRFRRLSRWLLIDQLPTHDQQNKTQIGAVPQSKREELEELLASGRYDDLLIGSEVAFMQYPFWLDAQRYSFFAMQASDDDYSGAMNQLLATLTGFLYQFPSLPDLSFIDGSPFANQQTREWISQVIGTGDDDGSEDEIENDLEEYISNAKLKASQGKRSDAISDLESLSRESKDKSRWFVLKIAQAEIFYLAGDLTMAIHQLDGLIKQMYENNCQDWDTKITEKLLLLTVKSYDQNIEKNKSRSSHLIDAYQKAFNQLVIINPERAYTLEPKLAARKHLLS